MHPKKPGPVSAAPAPAPVSAPASGHAPARPTKAPPLPQSPPTEPIEVLGRHQNTGQKDHKGAR